MTCPSTAQHRAREEGPGIPRRALAELGFTVLPSQTNFLFVRPPRLSAEIWRGKLREKNVWSAGSTPSRPAPFLRITVGKEADHKALLDAAKKILATKSGAE